jgi:uncharacterized Zn-binding protein involved in type VI secretion
MAAAARVGDTTTHTGSLAAPGVATVLIEGKPAAVIGGEFTCVPHVELGPANLIEPPQDGLRTVLVAGLPVACMLDETACGAKIATGALTVQVQGVL